MSPSGPSRPSRRSQRPKQAKKISLSRKRESTHAAAVENAGRARRRSEPKVDLSQFISGIYNYCDRWCERCPLTAKCYLYWQERGREAKHRAAGRDPYDWDVVLEDVRKNFQQAIEMLREAAEEHGVDLDHLSEVEDTSTDPSAHPLHQRAESYLKTAHTFLKDLHQRLAGEHATLEQRAMVLGPERVAGEYRDILDAHEVISWYHTLIPAKVHRALSSMMEAEQDEDEGQELHMGDALGSAKVAHESIVRSMAALRRVYDWDTGLEDQVIPLLADLDWMRRQIEESFPGFQNFRRPGLDPE